MGTGVRPSSGAATSESPTALPLFYSGISCVAVAADGHTPASSHIVPRLRHTKIDPEAAPFSYLGFDTYLPPHVFDYFTDQGQTDSRALITAVGALEHAENT